MEKGDSYLIVDIGEVKTKAALVCRINDTYRLIGTGEADTTLETPELDVMIGIKRAAEKVKDNCGIFDDIRSGNVRLICSSSDGSGLYMMVAGVISMISGESAQRAALGAGAHLIGIFSRDDPKPDYQIVENMRDIKPDIFLLAGGTDGGAYSQVLDMAKIIREADIKPRFGDEYKLPVIYAGNIDARDGVAATLTEDYATKAVDNVRPMIEYENLGPAKEAIYDSYMEHVISHSPGYENLAKIVYKPMIPTQAAIGKILYAFAERRAANLLAVNISRSTTDIYSVYKGVFNRSLNAEIGLTYGAVNVLKTVGVEQIARWLPENMDERKIRNIVGNLMVLHPDTTSKEEQFIVGALAREAIRLGVEEHKKLASRLKGVSVKRTIADTFTQSLESTYLDVGNTQIIVGMGKVFSGSAGEAAHLLLDAFEPLYLSELYVDRAGLIPHSGMFLDEAPEAAMGIFIGESMKRLGTCLCPQGWGEGEAVKIRLKRQSGEVVEESVNFGEIKVLPSLDGETCFMEAIAGKGASLGKARERQLETNVTGGILGLIIDARGRPQKTPGSKEAVRGWTEALSLVNNGG